MTTDTMTLEALAPAWLEAKVDVAEARKALRGRQHVPTGMESANVDHAAEVKAAERTGNPLITNGVALLRGNGSGFEVIHRACRCDGEAECYHDPRQSPYSAADIAKAEKAITKAEKALTKAEKHLAGTDPSFDAFENARSIGARFVWWPMDRNRDPRKHRYQGQPLTDDEIAGLGPHSLRRAVTNGSVIEVEQ